MKKGFRLLKTKEKVNIKYYKYVPKDYQQLQLFFELGEGSFLNDNIKKKEIDDFYLPLNNVVYSSEEIELFIEYLFSIEQINAMLEAGEKEEDYFKIDKLLKIANLSYPEGGHLYISIDEGSEGKIYIESFLLYDSKQKYKLIETDIFSFINNISLIENSYQMNNYSKDQLYRNWDEDFWRVRE